MSVPQPIGARPYIPGREIVWAVLIAAAIVVAIFALNVAFGVQGPGSYDILPDPAHLSGLSF